MGKGTLYLFLLIILAINVSADGEQILYSGTAAPGEIDASGVKAYVTITNTLVRVKYMDTIVVSPNGQCKDENGIILCVASIEAPFQASITLKAAVAMLSVEKSFTSKSYSVGDLINVKTTIKNNGKGSAANLKLVDDISGFDVINPRGCNIVGDALVYESNVLGPSGGIVCEYSLKVKSDDSTSKMALVTYFDGLKENSASASASFSILPFGFDIKSSLDKGKLELGKANKVWFNLTLKSAKETKVNSLRIQFPEGITAISADGKYDWNGLVDPKKNIYREYNVTLKNPNRFSVVLLVDFIAEKIGYQIREYNVNVSYTKPIITFKYLNFSKEGDITPFYIENLNNFDMADVKVKLSSAKVIFKQKDFDVGDVKAGSLAKAGDVEFSAPLGVSPLFVDLSYKIADGSELKLSKSFRFNVDTSRDIIRPAEKDDKFIVADNKTDALNKEPVKKGFLCRVLGWMIKSLC